MKRYLSMSLTIGFIVMQPLLQQKTGVNEL